MAPRPFPGEYVTYSDTGNYSGRCYVAYYDVTNADLLFRQVDRLRKDLERPGDNRLDGDVGKYCSMTVYKVPMIDSARSASPTTTRQTSDLKYAYFVDDCDVNPHG